MIPLKRHRSSPVIHKNFHDEKQAEYNLELLENQRKIRNGELKKHDFTSSRWGKAKTQLLIDTHNKCAYCESPTALVAYGDVEHYRPKSKYWWLAYCYDNYLASCQICNQKYKKAKFSVQNRKMKPSVNVRKNSSDDFLSRKKHLLAPLPLDSVGVARLQELHDTERPYIINPYVEDPATWFAWEADDNLGQVTLIPAPGTPNAKKFVEAAENDLGLNRKELKDLRYEYYDNFVTFKLTISEPRISEALKVRAQRAVDRMLSDQSAFAGMLRYFDAQFI